MNYFFSSQIEHLVKVAKTAVFVKKTAVFAERYKGAAIEATGLGGEGGGFVGMPLTVTPGGERITGTAAVGSNGEITFTPDAA